MVEKHINLDTGETTYIVERTSSTGETEKVEMTPEVYELYDKASYDEARRDLIKKTGAIQAEHIIEAHKRGELDITTQSDVVSSTGEKAQLEMTQKFAEKYREAQREEEARRLREAQYVEQERKAAQERQKIEAAQELAKNPIVRASYIFNPDEWFGLGVLSEAAVSGLTGQSWQKNREKMMTSYSYGLISSNKTPIQAGLEVGLITGGKAALMAAPGGAFGKAAGKAADFSLKGMYAFDLGQQAITTARTPTGENIARTFVYSVPLLVSGAAKGVKGVKAAKAGNWPKIVDFKPSKMMKGMAGKTETITKTKKKPTTGLGKVLTEWAKENVFRKKWERLARKGKTKLSFSEYYEKQNKLYKSRTKGSSLRKEVLKEALKLYEYQAAPRSDIVYFGEPKIKYKLQKTFPAEVVLPAVKRKKGKSISAMISPQLPLGKLKSPVKPITKQYFSFKSMSKQASAQAQAQKQKQREKQSFLLDFDFKKFFPRTGGLKMPKSKPKPITPFMPLPKPLSKPKTKKRGKRKKKSILRKYEYTPSLAGALDIVKPLKAPPNITTGLKFRPKIRR